MADQFQCENKDNWSMSLCVDHPIQRVCSWAWPFSAEQLLCSFSHAYAADES